MKKSPILPKKVYYLLNYTWGLPLIIVGWIVSFCLRSYGIKPIKYGPCLIFQAGGNNWGGFSIGTTIVMDTDPNNFAYFSDLPQHEFGHSVQNALFGPFMPFLVSIPSFIRYWIVRHREDVDYDSVWFEGTATQWGIDNYEKVWKND